MLITMTLNRHGVNRAQSLSGDQKGFTVEVTERQVLKEGLGFPEGRLCLGIQGCGDSMCNSLEERKVSAVVGNGTQFGLACMGLISPNCPLRAKVSALNSTPSIRPPLLLSKYLPI